MSSRNFDFKGEWEKLRNGLQLIINICRGSADAGKISFEEWQGLYFIAYTWFTSLEEPKKHELYQDVSKFFEQVVQEECDAMKGKRGYILLKDYLTRFANYTNATSKIKNIFAYPHRYWIPAQITQGDTSIREIFELSLVKWREKCYTPLAQKLRDALIALVTAERDGENVDKTLLSNMVQAYIQIGVPPVENPVHFYKTQFQDHFIKTTKEYYSTESDTFIRNNSVSAYMQKAEARILQEEQLAQTYLHPSTKQDLVNACDETLIERHNQQLQDEFQKMLRDDKDEDMRRFYYLLSRIPGGLDRSADTMKQFLSSVGTGIVKDHSAKLTSRASLGDSSPLILALLDLHKKYSDILHRCMQDAKLFSKALDEAFTVFINLKAGVLLMAEVLNNYVDAVMTAKEKLAEGQVYETLDAVVRLFTYFNDKDVFYDAFRRSLSKRLLTNRIFDDWERHFIQRLKITCGDSYTKKLEGMFLDIKRSKDIHDPNFQRYLKEQDKYKLDGTEMTITVLSENFWPSVARTTLNPSPEFQPAINAFTDHYQKANPKHILVWLFTSGDCQVTHNFRIKGKVIPITLTVSCTQACILLLYNQSPHWKFADLMSTLGTTEDQLKWSITPLVYTQDRLIVNKGPGGKGAPKDEEGKPLPLTVNSLQDQDLMVLTALRQPKKRIVYAHGKQLPGGKVPVVSPGVTKERELRIQLALVRVMKNRGTLMQNSLVAEATKQLQNYFLPEPRLMKKQIEVLMERGFMRRDADEMRKIHYCA